MAKKDDNQGSGENRPPSRPHEWVKGEASQNENIRSGEKRQHGEVEQSAPRPKPEGSGGGNDGKK
jgi:hypothetical protein